MSKSQPFDGLTVVDFTHVLAGPACAYFLGLLGADVIKVESAGKGDAIRHRGGTDESAAGIGMSTSYLTQAAGKRSLAIALGRDDWLADPRFAERSQRKLHADDLGSEIEKELARKSAAEWEPVLQRAGVPCARLRTLPECLESEQVTSRGFIHRFKDGLSVPTLPFRLNGAAVHAPVRPAPLHGADTDEIKAWLGGRK